jgi:hypothetical protein
MGDEALAYPADLFARGAAEPVIKALTYQHHRVDGVPRRFALPITFTPFASATPCTARCRFCSETLVHRRATGLSAALRPGPGYGAQLRQALQQLRGLQMGLSLSGLEATSDADWLLDVLAATGEHEREGAAFAEKVLYTNGSGLAAWPNRLTPVLREAKLTRIEISRHSDRRPDNDRIMRFRGGVAVAGEEGFAQAIRNASSAAPVALVCILQAGGISRLEDVERYLGWARTMGVRQVIFRELSRLHDLYRPNATYRYIDAVSVPIEPTLRDALVSGRFEAIQGTLGYYYWNLRTKWAESVDVTFESSDYQRMKALHAGDTVYKLVFHANGQLCADWDPNTRVLLSTSD